MFMLMRYSLAVSHIVWPKVDQVDISLPIQSHQYRNVVLKCIYQSFIRQTEVLC